jgi:hypothetical protein
MTEQTNKIVVCRELLPTTLADIAGMLRWLNRGIEGHLEPPTYFVVLLPRILRGCDHLGAGYRRQYTKGRPFMRNKKGHAAC